MSENRLLRRDRRRAFRVAYEAVRKILWEDWDPIGCGVPEDEYDSYAPRVVGLLMRGEGREAVAAYLRETADQTIECPVPKERLALVLDKLLALKLEHKTKFK